MTNKEEEIMQVIWKLEKVFVKEILEQLPEPKPHYNTISTIVRNLEKDGFLGHEAFGNTHRYFPLIGKDQYRKKFLNSAIARYFGNSYKSMVAAFAKEEKLSVDDLKDIIDMIEKGDQ